MKRHWIMSLMVCCLVLLVSRIGMPAFADNNVLVARKVVEKSIFKQRECTGMKFANDSKCINSRKIVRYEKAKRAGNIVVMKGDNLSCLSYKLYGNAKFWRLIAVANGISTTKPRFIYPGEKLLVPKLKSRHGKKATEVSEEIKSGETQMPPAENNEKNTGPDASEEKSSTDSVEQSSENDKIPEKPIQAQSDETPVVVEKKEELRIAEKKVQSTATENADKVAISHTRHKFEMYVGAEKYQQAEGPKELEDRYWAKVNIRPIKYSLTKNVEGNLGIFAYGAASHGFITDRENNEFEYGTREGAFGLSNKLYGRDWNAGTDIGVGRLWLDRGSRVSEAFIFQRDDSFYLSQTVGIYGRRFDGLRILPVTEISFDLRMPFDTESQYFRTRQIDNAYVGGLIFQGLYDFNLWKDYYLTPGLNLGGGRDFRAPSTYAIFGPGISLYYGTTPVLKIDVYNYKMNFSNDGRWYTFAGVISLHGVWKAIYGALIKEVSQESVPTLYPSEKNDHKR